MLGHSVETDCVRASMDLDDTPDADQEQELEQEMQHGDAPSSEQLAGAASDISLLWSGDDIDNAISMQETARERAEARRLRHREVQRRFAQRKKEKLQQDRVLLQQLEARYKLLSLIAEQQQLAEENNDLERSCLAYSLVSPPKPVIHSIIQSQMEAVRDNYEPVSEDQWGELLQNSLQDYERSRYRGHGGWATTGATIMGWRDRIVLENSSIKLSMEKDFKTLDSHEFAERAWDRMCSPDHHPRFFSHGLTVKMQVLQCINVDAVVINRCIYNPRTNAIGHTLEMFCRVLRGRDTIIISRSFENMIVQQTVEFHHQHVHTSTGVTQTQRWPQLMASFVFAALPSGGCRFHYGCRLRSFTAASANYWMMELPAVLWRFEAVTVGSTFSLRAQEDSAEESSPPDTTSYSDRTDLSDY